MLFQHEIESQREVWIISLVSSLRTVMYQKGVQARDGNEEL